MKGTTVTTTKLLTGLACTVLLTTSLSSQAALVQLIGDSVIYEYDDATNAAALALFGTPTIAGDDVRFLPPSFRAESVDGAGSDVVSANFIFSRVYSINGDDIAEIQVLEFGDYEITNGDSVSADLLLTASSNVDFFDFASDMDSFDAAGDSAGLATWQLLASVDPTSVFSSAANDIAVSIQNTLVATTDAFGETAWIQKKLSFTATTVVPVPAAAWLFGSALMGLMALKRRK